MGAHGTIALLVSCWLAWAGPAFANPPPVRVDVRAGPMASALRDVARQARIELLFDRSLVRNLRAPALRGTYRAEEALRRLLAGTNIRVRRTASGILVLEATAPSPPLAVQDVDVPEILVIGRRSQNADIRRLEGDVQPYRVATRRDIRSAHRDNLDQYFRSRVTANTQVASPSQLENGETVSEIDLRGLGTDGTLILVDGRRMPGIPRVPFGFRQPDVNAIPFSAVERVETLTGTAGGIHGFGALGGAVNIVLDREKRGIELLQTVGLSSRGDARRINIEGSAGFSLGDGRTEISVGASRSWSDALDVGERHFKVRDRRLSARNLPETFLGTLPNGNSISVFSLNGDFGTPTNASPLVFKPEFGGASLGARYTFLPVGFDGTRADLIASLQDNAGSFDPSLSQDEARSDIGSAPETWSVIGNIRHRFGVGFEAYADVLVFHNRGRYAAAGTSALLALPEASPVNPFAQPVFLTLPLGGNEREMTTSFRTSRYTLGVVADLPLGWRGTAEAGFGAVRLRRSSLHRFDFFSASLLYDDPSASLEPFGDWDAFLGSLPLSRGANGSETRLRTRFREQSLRLAGPFFSLSGGRSTLTLLAERREDDVPMHVERGYSELDGSRFDFESEVEGRSTTTKSLYGELRSLLFGEDAPFVLLRQLELQLALRSDWQTIYFDKTPANPTPAERARARFAGTAVTVGLKLSPASWLTLRGSYATGEQPPDATFLIESAIITRFGSSLDPKRPGTFVGDNGPFLLRSAGFAGLLPARATTLSLGTILSPWGADGPRVTLDYSRIRRTRDVQVLGAVMVLENEDFWPERVERGPLTDADRARGFTAGPILAIDSRATNGGALEVRAIDASFEWPLAWLGGELRLRGEASHHMRNRQSGLFRPDVERAGYRFGPLKWRANLGVQWSDALWSMGANLQYFGPYRVYSVGTTAIADAARLQGGRNVDAQAYLDLHVSRRVRVEGVGPLRELSLAFGAINILDSAPPRESSFNFREQGFSRYGDPRRRRFEFSLSSRF